MEIDAGFPGGNIVVESIDGSTVRLRQDLRDTPRHWFYWCFRVRGAAGRTVNFEFTSGDVFGPMGPCLSLDGRDWRWLGRGVVEGHSFTCTFPDEANEAYLSFCIPYTQADLDEFLASRPRGERHVLTQSEQGHEVEHLILPSSAGRYKVLITARQHACEAVANFVLEGIIDAWNHEVLRTRVDLHAIPFVDKDGVESGDQGKLRSPHDHWEDYSDSPIYASTRALMAQAGGWPGEFLLAIDLHCPSIRDTEIMIVEPEPELMPLVEAFAHAFEQTRQGRLSFDRRHWIPFGKGWNVEGPDFAGYFRRRGGAGLAFTLEIPYALAGSEVVTVDTAREFGNDLARATARYASALQ